MEKAYKEKLEGIKKISEDSGKELETATQKQHESIEYQLKRELEELAENEKRKVRSKETRIYCVLF
jgi:hypothetical protein